MPRTENNTRPGVKTDSKENSLAPILLLFSDDEALATFVDKVVTPPWKLVRHGADKYGSREAFAQPNVRVVIFDDQTVDEDDRGWMLARIRKHLSGSSLMYVAGSQSDANEKRARANGAHYYTSKPLSVERFGQVLRSFLLAQQFAGRSGHSKVGGRPESAGSKT